MVKSVHFHTFALVGARSVRQILHVLVSISLPIDQLGYFTLKLPFFNTMTALNIALFYIFNSNSIGSCKSCSSSPSLRDR